MPILIEHDNSDERFEANNVDAAVGKLLKLFGRGIGKVSRGVAKTRRKKEAGMGSSPNGATTNPGCLLPMACCFIDLSSPFSTSASPRLRVKTLSCKVRDYYVNSSGYARLAIASITPCTLPGRGHRLFGNVVSFG